jgi:arylsulfatase A
MMCLKPTPPEGKPFANLGCPSTFSCRQRSFFLRLSGLAWCLGLLLVLHGLHAKVREPLDRPNIILIFLDDAGYGDFAHHGNPTIETPAISRLAWEGAQFTQFYTASPACSASRYALLTGRVPSRSGLGSWVIGPNATRYLHPREQTLAEGLQQKGYATALFGKWHLGNPNDKNLMAREAFPLSHGFDQWLGTNVSHDYDEAALFRSDSEGVDPVAGYTRLADRLPSNAEASRSLTDRYTEATLEFITQHAQHPFFVYLAHNQPHLGLYASASFEGSSRRGLLGDVMAQIDDSLAQIRHRLEDLDIASNTLIVFSSDNGPWLRFKETASHPKYGEARLHVGNAYPFRDGKGSTWEGGHRVPGLFYWPGVIEGQTRLLEPASTLDIFPTLMRAAGQALPDDRSLDGRNLLPWLAPKRFNGTVAPFRFVYCYSDNQPSALRQGAWKLHVRIGSQIQENHGFVASEQSPLLFDVEADLGERFNRADTHPSVVRSMLMELGAYRRQIETEGTFWDR